MNHQKILETLKKFNSANITVMGDLILDEYLFGNVDRISPEAPVPVIDILSGKLTIGGAANAGLNIENLGANTAVIGCVGNDLAGEKLISIMKDQQIDTRHIIKAQARKTIHKTRIVSKPHNQQLLRIDSEDRIPISDENEKSLIDSIISQAQQSDALLISDYSKGLITTKLAKIAVDSFRSHNKPVVVDSKAFNLSHFFGATVLTPNQKEAQESSGIRIVDDDSLIRAGNNLLVETQSTAILITRGDKGCALFETDKEPRFIKSFASEVFDVTGAGDTVASVLALSLAAGLDIYESVYLANIAAGITVRHFGAYAPSKKEIVEMLKTLE